MPQLFNPMDSLELQSQLSQYIHSLVGYHPYKIYGEANPQFNQVSGYLLDLKDSSNRNFNLAIAHFYPILANYLRNNAILTPDYIGAYVPSSTAGKKSPGLAILLSKLAEDGIIKLANPNLLNRKTSIKKLAHGGDRSPQNHINTIEVSESLAPETKIFLIDDVTTTGNSLAACGFILKKAGAKNIIKLAIGKTT